MEVCWFFQQCYLFKNCFIFIDRLRIDWVFRYLQGEFLACKIHPDLLCCPRKRIIFSGSRDKH